MRPYYEENAPERDQGVSESLLTRPDQHHHSGSGATQRDRVLAHLLRGWTCGRIFLEEFIPRYGARIWSLKNDDGYRISRRRCENPGHDHRSLQYEWRIEPDAEPKLPGLSDA